MAEAEQSAVVPALRRPPVRQATVVRSDVGHTFQVHRGWEALSDEQLAEDCALPGGYAGGSFDRGWTQILACLARAIEPGEQPR